MSNEIYSAIDFYERHPISAQLIQRADGGCGLGTLRS
jgi:hypothetical protein